MTRKDPFDREKERQAQSEMAKAKEHENLNDLYNVMATVEGRRFIYRLLSDCGNYRTSFNTNALSMAFNEGQRNVGLMLQSKAVASCPSFYAQMLKENGGDNAK